MEHDTVQSGLVLPIDIAGLASSIAREQRESGEIPWHGGGKTDPWDHVEAAIGLTLGVGLFYTLFMTNGIATFIYFYF